MTLRLIDGAGGYDTAIAPRRWTVWLGTPTVNATGGRRSGPSIRLSNWQNRFSITLDAQTTWIIGFAFKVAALPSTGMVVSALQLAAANQVSVLLKADGFWEVRSGGITGTIIGTSSFAPIIAGVFSYIEIKYFVHTTFGVVVIKKDGIEVLNITSVNTAAAGGSTADAVRFSINNNTSEACTVDFDDIYICDGSGVAPQNNFLGDLGVYAINPNAVGTYSQWTPLSSTNVSNVDEAVSDDDASYVFAVAPGVKDSYNFPSVTPTVGTVFGVETHITARKDDTETRTIKDLILSALSLTSLQAYWKLEEASGSRADSVGSNTLTDNNTVTQAVGKIGNAAQFTAANSEYLSIADNAALSMGDIDFTIFGWVYFDSGAGDPILAGKYLDTGNQREYAIRYNTAANRISFQVSSDGTVALEIILNDTVPISAGVWYLVVAWHDSVANTLNIQVNNGTINSVGHSAGVFNGTAPFQIGARGNPANYLSGRMDGVGVFKRVLTAAERTVIYNNGNGFEYPWSEREGTARTLTTSYDMYDEVHQTVDGIVAWDITTLNAAEFGVKAES